MIKVLFILCWFLVDYILFGLIFVKVQEIVNKKFINFFLFMILRAVSLLFIAFALQLFKIGGLLWFMIEFIEILLGACLPFISEQYQEIVRAIFAPSAVGIVLIFTFWLIGWFCKTVYNALIGGRGEKWYFCFRWLVQFLNWLVLNYLLIILLVFL